MKVENSNKICQKIIKRLKTTNYFKRLTKSTKSEIELSKMACLAMIVAHLARETQKLYRKTWKHACCANQKQHFKMALRPCCGILSHSKKQQAVVDTHLKTKYKPKFKCQGSTPQKEDCRRSMLRVVRVKLLVLDLLKKKRFQNKKQLKHNWSKSSEQ